MCRGTELRSDRVLENIEPITSMRSNLSAINEKLKDITVESKQKYARVEAPLLANGQELILSGTDSSVKKCWSLSFETRVPSGISSFVLGRTTEIAERNGFLVIEPTKLEYYPNLSSAAYRTVSYDLSGGFRSNVQFSMTKAPGNILNFTLVSEGTMVSGTFNGFENYELGNWHLIPYGGDVSGVAMSWQPDDILKKTWVFGDSWIGFYESKWTWWMEQYGYGKNYLLDGFPGENAQDGTASFRTLLKYGTPKDAIFALGMNDRTDLSGVPSNQWTVYRDEFLQLCQDNGVTPVFTTIPSTPTIDHSAKNAWIRSSGYRYIDFDKAVGADLDRNWYAGMHSTTSPNHPTEAGARALFMRFLVDYPEVMQS